MKKINYKDAGESVYYEKLANGLEVFMYPKSTAKNFYLAYNVKFGSVDTEFKSGKERKFTKVPSGTAHFLEHQMFQEDKGHTAFEYYATLGSSVNAFTTYDYTSYEVIASDRFKENLEYLLDYVGNPVFKSSSVDKERGIIKEEIKMYDNAPLSVLNFGLEYNLNNVDNHKYLISGTEDDIKEITAETLQKCYDTFYTPSNMFLVLTGNFSPMEALGIIKENQAKREIPLKRKVTKKTPKEPLSVPVPYFSREMDVGMPKLKIAYKLDKSSFKNYTDLDLKVYLDAILYAKFGETSDLYETLVEGNLAPFGVYATREVRTDYILLSFEVDTEYKEQVIDLIRSELKSIKLSRDEMERVRRANISSFLLHFNDIIDVAQDIEDEVLSNGKIREDIIDYYRGMEVRKANNIAALINLKNECIYYIDKLTV